MKQIHDVVIRLNNSKVFAGVIMVLLNIASRYITVKLSPSQETCLKKYISRELFIFATCWLGTRDIYVALGVSLLFFIVANYIFNEDSPYGLIGRDDDDKPVPKEELDNAIKILKKAKEQEEEKTKDELYNFYVFKQ